MEHLLWEHQITIKEKEIEVIMEQYIDKAAVVAEIERLREEEYPCDTFEESTGYYNALDEIATFLNTLEVKDANDAYKQGYNDAIDKFCKFMQNCEGYVVSGNKCNYDNFIKYMEEQQ